MSFGISVKFSLVGATAYFNLIHGVNITNILIILRLVSLSFFLSVSAFKVNSEVTVCLIFIASIAHINIIRAIAFPLSRRNCYDYS